MKSIRSHNSDYILNNYLSKYIKATKIYRKFCESLFGCTCDRDDVEPGWCIGCRAMATLQDADNILGRMNLMDIKQAKTKLTEISESTGTKHPKVLVSELCVVVKFLLDEIDRIKSPLLTVLPKRILEDVKIDPPPRPPRPMIPHPPEEFPQPPPLKRCSGNAGDAQ